MEDFYFLQEKARELNVFGNDPVNGLNNLKICRNPVSGILAIKNSDVFSASATISGTIESLISEVYPSTYSGNEWIKLGFQNFQYLQNNPEIRQRMLDIFKNSINSFDYVYYFRKEFSSAELAGSLFLFAENLSAEKIAADTMRDFRGDFRRNYRINHWELQEIYSCDRAFDSSLNLDSQSLKEAYESAKNIWSFLALFESAEQAEYMIRHNVKRHDVKRHDIYSFLFAMKRSDESLKISVEGKKFSRAYNVIKYAMETQQTEPCASFMPKIKSVSSLDDAGFLNNLTGDLFFDYVICHGERKKFSEFLEYLCALSYINKEKELCLRLSQMLESKSVNVLSNSDMSKICQDEDISLQLIENIEIAYQAPGIAKYINQISEQILNDYESLNISDKKKFKISSYLRTNFPEVIRKLSKRKPRDKTLDEFFLRHLTSENKKKFQSIIAGSRFQKDLVLDVLNVMDF